MNILILKKVKENITNKMKSKDKTRKHREKRNKTRKIR